MRVSCDEFGKEQDGCVEMPDGCVEMPAKAEMLTKVRDVFEGLGLALALALPLH